MSDRDDNEDRIERVLRALADLAAEDQDDSLPAPDDRRLSAYREGRLTPEEARELEGELVRSSAGRRRMLELSGIAGIDHSLPLRRVRKAVLAQASGRRRAPGWAAVAAMAAM